MKDDFYIEKPSDIDKCFLWVDAFASASIRAEKAVSVTISNDKHLTSTQNRAMHLWFSQCAQALNDANCYYEHNHVITGVTLSEMWDCELFKRYIYKPTLENLKGKLSTQDQDTVEPSLIAEAIARAFAIHKQITLPFWPSKK